MQHGHMNYTKIIGFLASRLVSIVVYHSGGIGMVSDNPPMRLKLPAR